MDNFEDDIIKKDKAMRIMFILDYSFPSSSAASNRIEALSKGFHTKGHFVDVVCLRGTWIDNKSRADNRINVHFTGSKLRPENFIKRNILKFSGMLKSFTYVYRENIRMKINFVFLPVNKNILGLLYYIFFRILNIKIVQERSEYPEIYKRNIWEKINYFLYIKFLAKLLDGMIVMTSNLNLYYSKILNKKSILKIIPMSVDMDRFKTTNEIEKENYISYCGDLNNFKDGVDILIKAFGLVSPGHPDWRLCLIGGSTESQLKVLKKLCIETRIENKVEFTGKMDKSKIPEMLMKSKILALARPSSLQAQGGFPTKLGEYLATQNPVVITDVGEIKYYLKNNESAYISKPDSYEDFASKLEKCICNYGKAQGIGMKGYEVAIKYFDYKVQAVLLDDFLFKLSN